MKLLRATIIAGLATSSMSACVINKILPESYAPPPPVMPVAAPATDGAIYQGGMDMRLFEDLKANRVGDILTIRLTEQTSASKSSSTSISKAGEADYQSPTLLGRPVSLNSVPILSSALSASQTFDGEGDSAQSNSLQGDITVTVVERFANGNLRIRGEKWVTINQGREFVRVSGIIRPYDIATDNTVASTDIADARITYSGKGVLAAANKMGFLQKFLNSVLHPF